MMMSIFQQDELRQEMKDLTKKKRKLQKRLRLVEAHLEIMNAGGGAGLREPSPRDLGSGGFGSRGSATPSSVTRSNRTVRRPKKYSEEVGGGTVKLSGPINRCRAILKQLQRHKDAIFFLEPVDPVALKIPDYFKVIKNPMDLKTVETKMEELEYEETRDFASDVRLVWSNACTYNPPSSLVHQKAQIMSRYFEERFRTVPDGPMVRINSGRKKRKRSTLISPGGTPAANVEMIYAQVSEMQRLLDNLRQNPGAGNMMMSGLGGFGGGQSRQPRRSGGSSRRSGGGGRSRGKRGISLREKQTLMRDIQSLDATQQEGIAQLVQETRPDLVTDDGNVELDIHKLDVKTIRILQKYVREEKSRRRGGRSGSSQRPSSARRTPTPSWGAAASPAPPGPGYGGNVNFGGAQGAAGESESSSESDSSTTSDSEYDGGSTRKRAGAARGRAAPRAQGSRSGTASAPVPPVNFGDPSQYGAAAGPSEVSAAVAANQEGSANLSAQPALNADAWGASFDDDGAAARGSLGTDAGANNALSAAPSGGPADGTADGGDDLWSRLKKQQSELVEQREAEARRAAEAQQRAQEQKAAEAEAKLREEELLRQEAEERKRREEEEQKQMQIDLEKQREAARRQREQNWE